MTTSPKPRNPSYRQEERYRNFLLISEPHQHEDDTFSAKFRITMNENLVFAYANTRLDESYSTGSVACQAGILAARNWIEKHTALWARGNQ